VQDKNYLMKVIRNKVRSFGLCILDISTTASCVCALSSMSQ